ncbi:MAG: YihY family inner membrane protein [Deltaproteobacteria bacterium]|nr:YihY family inner membrane protein [Deltaproteobacteria bacterium]
MLSKIRSWKKLFANLPEKIESHLWVVREEAHAWWVDLAFHIARVFYLVISGFFKNRCIIRATALAYASLLSIVPLLAVVFFLFHAFGGLSKVAEKIKPFIFENLAAGSGQIVYEQITQFIENVHANTIGAIGILVLIITAIGLMTAIEAAFNEIWGVKKQRSLGQRYTLYWSMLTLGPLLLAVSISLTTAFQSTQFVQKILSLPYVAKIVISAMPILTSWLAFFILYYAIPNTPVKIRSAGISALVGGSLWELAKWGYALYAAKVVTYHTIYGSLGAIPIFLIWLYVAWVIVLIGAEVAFADQNVKTYLVEEESAEMNQAEREWHALRILAVICEAFSKNESAPTIRKIQSELGIPIKLTHEMIFFLSQLQLIHEVSRKEGTGYIPAASPEQMRLSDIIKTLRGRVSPSRKKRDSALSTFYEKLEKSSENTAQSMTICDLY